MNLIIVESPTKAKTLSKFLQGEFWVESTQGHIKDLPREKLAVDVDEDFTPSFQLIKKRKKVVTRIRKVSKNARKVYLATDPDREGEAIAFHVKQILPDGSFEVLRIVFHEITKEAVEEALRNPRDIDRNLVDAQLARRILDRLVGYKLSPLLWRKVRRGLSAGRVQSVALRLIVEREKEIKEFKPEKYWEIYCLLKKRQTPNLKFKVKLEKEGGKKLNIKDEKDALTLVSQLKVARYKVSKINKKRYFKSPHPPFTTSTMTQAAARIFGWSAKKTMSIAQRLYEEGFITYHRTDSVNLAKTAVDSLRNFIKREFGEKYSPSAARIFKKTSKLAQEAHEAIRPTNVLSKDIEIPGFKAESDAKKLYKLIWKRFVACQMSDALLERTSIEVEARNGKVYLLRASGEVMKFDGWTKVIPLKIQTENILPELERGEELDLLDVLSEKKFTQPPPRYSEASLIKTLEKLGIGRPSTYAPIISTLKQRSYVEKREGKFIPTNLGIAVCDFLTQNFPEIFDYRFTAMMEDQLDEIAKGRLGKVSMLSQFYKPFEMKLSQVLKNTQKVKIQTEKLGRQCPLCGKGELVVRVGKYGKFISCSRFPECGYKEKYVEKVGLKCPECKKGEVIVKVSKKGKRFYGCSRFPKCKWASWRKPQANALAAGVG